MKAVIKHLVFTLVAATLLGGSAARAASFDVASDDVAGPPPRALKEVKLVQHIGAKLPLDLSFTDESGKAVRLGDYFKSGKPVVLQLGYYACPQLCDLISRGLLASVQKLSFTAGSDYELVFVSIDPAETPAQAAQKKQEYINQGGRGVSGGWHFLTGRQDAITALAQADGFEYKWIESAGRFAHPAALTLCMPDGRISRYLNDLQPNPTTLRESLVEASSGKIGNVVDQLFLSCFRFDGHQGKYALAAIGAMRAGGVLVMIIVGAVLIRMFLREAKQRAREEGKAE